MAGVLRESSYKVNNRFRVLLYRKIFHGEQHHSNWILCYQELWHIRSRILSSAKSSYNQDHFDLIITGHMHVRDDYNFEIYSKPIRSINLGSWFDEAKGLKLENKKVEWISLDI